MPCCACLHCSLTWRPSADDTNRSMSTADIRAASFARAIAKQNPTTFARSAKTAAATRADKMRTLVVDATAKISSVLPLSHWFRPDVCLSDVAALHVDVATNVDGTLLSAFIDAGVRALDHVQDQLRRRRPVFDDPQAAPDGVGALKGGRRGSFSADPAADDAAAAAAAAAAEAAFRARPHRPLLPAVARDGGVMRAVLRILCRLQSMHDFAYKAAVPSLAHFVLNSKWLHAFLPAHLLDAARFIATNAGYLNDKR